VALQIAVSQAALTVNQYVNPIALASIGFYYYNFFLGMLVLGVSPGPTILDFPPVTDFAPDDHHIFLLPRNQRLFFGRIVYSFRGSERCAYYGN
jgi:hypothetical protein